MVRPEKKHVVHQHDVRIGQGERDIRFRHLRLDITFRPIVAVEVDVELAQGDFATELGLDQGLEPRGQFRAAPLDADQGQAASMVMPLDQFGGQPLQGVGHFSGRHQDLLFRHAHLPPFPGLYPKAATSGNGAAPGRAWPRAQALSDSGTHRPAEKKLNRRGSVQGVLWGSGPVGLAGQKRPRHGCAS